jgi:hypothetical protein
VEFAEEIAAAGLRWGEEIFQDGELPEGFAEGKEFARGGEAERDAAGEALEVLNAAEFLANLAADNGLLEEMGNGAEAGLDGVEIDERAKHPGAEHAGAHAGDGGVECGDEGGGAGGFRFFGEDGGDEFEIADRDGIEDERVVLFVIADAIEMAEGFEAGSVVAAGGIFAEVVYDGACGGEGLRMIVEAEAGEFGDTELFAEDALGVVGVEDPVFDAGFDAAGAVEEGGFCGFEELLRAREKGFAGTDELQFVTERFLRVWAREFSGLEFAGGEIDQGEAYG